jgi:hypothetical protein
MADGFDALGGHRNPPVVLRKAMVQYWLVPLFWGRETGGDFIGRQWPVVSRGFSLEFKPTKEV